MDGIGRRIRTVLVQQVAAVGLLAVFGTAVAIALTENLLLRHVIAAETEALSAQLAADPQARLVDDAFFSIRIARSPAETARIPPALRALEPGFHRGYAGGRAVQVTDTPAGRLYVMFVRQFDYLLALGGGLMVVAAIVSAAAAWVGYRASRRALAPVAALAEVVQDWDPKQAGVEALLPWNLPRDVAMDDDVASLSLALHGFASRLEEFVERERNFTRDVSHELRTPLTVIKVGADMLLEEEDLSPFATRMARRVRRAAREMESLIDSFLILAREDGVGLPEEDFTVNEAVREELERAMPLVADKPVRLNLEERGVIGLHASPRAFGVLVGNLVRNACLYTEQGAVTVTIERASLVVRDTGVGMSEHDLEHVHELFYRGGRGSGAEGHGIGLSLVKRLSDRFGWPVRIDSQLGVGTTVRVDFPETKAA